MLFIPLIFSCNNEPLEIIENQISEFAGLWSGLIEGENTGTWTFSVNNNGSVDGSITSYKYNQMYTISGSVNNKGFLDCNVTLIEPSRNYNVGAFVGNLGSNQFFGSFDNQIHSSISNTSGRSSTDDESKIINYWYLYSAEYENGDIYYYDNSRYCPDLYMDFNSGGTFTDYVVADYSENPNPICSQDNAFFGTFSVQDGYYQLTYEAGGSQDLSGSDIYILFPDSNSMRYLYDSVLWTYKLDIPK